MIWLSYILQGFGMILALAAAFATGFAFVREWYGAAAFNLVLVVVNCVLIYVQVKLREELKGKVHGPEHP